MSSREINLLFSIPVSSTISNNFSKENKKILIENYSHNKDGNLISDNKFLLNKYPSLKNWILNEVNLYARNAMACEEEIRITQSWSIISNNNLHFHQHPNSVISGAYYVNADENSSNLVFSKPYTNGQILWNTSESLYEKQDWLWDNIYFKPSTGKLILFPSYLNHGVISNQKESNRCVLSFNTWFVNPIGSIENLTFLD